MNFLLCTCALMLVQCERQHSCLQPLSSLAGQRPLLTDLNIIPARALSQRHGSGAVISRLRRSCGFLSISISIYSHSLGDWCLGLQTKEDIEFGSGTKETMKSYPSFAVCVQFLHLSCMVGVVTATDPYMKPGFLDFYSWFWNTPRGPQMYSCITYIEKNLQVDCIFPETHKIPGPFCEFKQDGRLMGSTYPNTPVQLIPPIETRRRVNVSLVAPNICRLTWMPMSDNRAYMYTCKVYQGSTWKENSMAFHQRNLLVCSALSIFFHSGPWILGVVISLLISLGLLS